LVWFKFLLCVIIILFAGTKLARYGDVIAEKTGLGRIWIGLVLIASITTMPELVTGVSASAGIGILLIAIAAGSIFAGERLSGATLGWVGISSIVIMIVYLVGTWQMFRFERRHQLVSLETELLYEEASLKRVSLKFALASVAVIGAGIWLSLIGDEIAATTGWGASFVGSLFLAITTSLPELAVAVAAFRLGAPDMAVADILGANIIDIAVILWVDLFYTPGSILAMVSSAHVVTAVISIVMSLLIVLGIRFRQRRKTFILFSWYTPVLIGLYVFGAYALFTSGIGLG